LKTFLFAKIYLQQRKMKKKFRRQHLRTLIAGGGDHLPHPPPAWNFAVHGCCVSDRPGRSLAHPTFKS
jgi:hypothetical protein